MLKVGGVSGHMTAEGDTGALTLTGADGTAITLNITKVKETPGKDIDAEFAFADRKDDAVTLARKDQTNGTVNITINAEDDVTIAAKVSAEEAAKLTDAEAILTAGGKVRVEQKERTVTNEAGEEAAQAYTVLVFTEGDTELEVEATGVAQTDSRRIIFVSATGEEVDLNIYNLTEVMTPSMPRTFAQVLMWTLIWAFFATFLNYFLGMLVAIMINKKGIKFKKLWRTILVMTIAIPQFISLLYVSKMFAADGLVNGMLLSFFGDGGTLENWIKEVALRFNSEGLYAWADGMKWMAEPLPFWTNANWAKVTIIGINVWIGIPYLMLIATGILMNIPADLYESARIDGANAFQTYMKITLPYMLFVTGPYLLTSFTGNINNFNVIFLLSGGKPTGMGLSGNAGSTDLLITWLYKMTVNDNNYKLAAVLGILVFVVCAVINLVVYNLIPSVKNEEDFQ
ncbi:MAG: sugar ABC transporter permease [Clostridia bacterium]|nr:sugar ABC transporter permease [Clostridia bacterium]